MYTTLLESIVSGFQSSLVVVDAKGFVRSAYLTGRTQTLGAACQGKPFKKLVSIIFDTHNCQLILDKFHTCKVYSQYLAINQLKHITSSKSIEYFDCSFTPAPEGSAIIFFRNVTETVLLHEEFFSITKQYEALNQDLCIAMANQDFQLMDLENTKKKLAALYRITAVVQNTVDEIEVLNEILSGITRELGFTNAAILLVDNDSHQLVIKAHKGYKNIRIPLSQGITGRAASEREVIYVPDVTKDRRYIPGTSNCVSEVAVPLIVNDMVIGVLDVETSEERSLKPYDLDLLRSLASQIAMTIAHANQFQQACIEASTDGLTDLSNHRHFKTILAQEFRRASRYKRPLSLLMIDIDNFKHYNDTNGHPQGDIVLRGAARLFKKYCRDTDFVFRYGGEEFAVLLPETTAPQAYIIAERIRKAIAEYPFLNRANQPGGALTVSIGIAGYPEDANSETELIDAADKALYNVKRSSRNRCCIYGTY